MLRKKRLSEYKYRRSLKIDAIYGRFAVKQDKTDQENEHSIDGSLYEVKSAKCGQNESNLSHSKEENEDELIYDIDMSKIN